MEDIQPIFSNNKLGLDEIRLHAFKDLSASQEMYTMRRSYYDVITNLYYLYDDFNDRETHANHANQMAATELTALLLELLQEELAL